MADEMDRAVEAAAVHQENSIAAVRAAADAIPRGQPGECEGCVDDSPRLVLTGGLMLCARCRDKRERRR